MNFFGNKTDFDRSDLSIGGDDPDDTNGEQIEEISGINPIRKSNNGSDRNQTSRDLSLRMLVLIGIAVVIVFVSQAFYHYPTEDEKIELENLENKMSERIPLKDWEKAKFCELLSKVRGIELFACKENYFSDIGRLTGYKVNSADLDWRGTGKSFVEALEKAFELTGVSKEKFKETKWAKDANGKTGVVEWKAPGGAEVNVDAPHTFEGPDVFHVGYKTIGKGKLQTIGHIFLDNVPYFRIIENE